jgi:ABC-type lipoprotein release transport system permease subunit
VNPLSAWTFYRRHKRRAALLLSTVGVVTAGIYLMVALIWAMFIEPGRSNFMFLSRFSVVVPRFYESVPDPAVIAQVTAQIRANPDVAQVIPASTIWIALPQVMAGGSTGFSLLGLMEEDMPYILERCGATLKEGKLPGPRTNGLLLSEKVAASLGLQVGDTIHDSINPQLYGNIAAPLEVVGILESDVRLGIMSLEFLGNHEFYRRFSAQFLVVARENREAAVDDFLRNEVQTNRTDVQTLQTLNEIMANEYLQAFVLLAPIVTILTIAFALVIVVVNRIAFSRRLPEFGILHATGLSKRWLIRRLTMETATLASVGWAVGIGLSWLALYLLKVTLFAPRGHDLNVIAWMPILLALPIPTAVVGFTLISVRRILSHLDPVAVVERGELSQEEDRKRDMTASKSSPKPLASATFYRRHGRRAVLLIGAMGLMIMAVVLLFFIDAVMADAHEPGLRYLSRVSRVHSPGAGQRLDPGVVAQIRIHPAVERVIPVAPRYSLLSVHIPPFLTSSAASPFGVHTEDMAYLVDLYGLELKEGRLPRPHTNEMVIPETIAQNRDLQIGDVIGDPDHPAYPGAQALPAEFVVSGIFARPSAPKDENWLGFVSLEFLESHEGFVVPDVPPLIVVPRTGQKEPLDDWLENELAGDDASVLTYRHQVARAQASARSQMLAMALLESVIAVVAATALAVLNHIFISQRQSEFGLLHALGYGRLRLVWRTVRETLFTTGVAWGLSAVLFLIGLLYLQHGVFKPLGLRLDFFNLTPWLFTLPIPVAVLAATTGTTVRTLSQLDPVSIIERR